jgi:hypothetical protein
MRNSRVWHYFLLELAWLAGGALYAVAMVRLAMFSQQYTDYGPVIVVTVMLLFPVFGFMLRQMWKTALGKVEAEDEEIMRKLRD